MVLTQLVAVERLEQLRVRCVEHGCRSSDCTSRWTSSSPRRGSSRRPDEPSTGLLAVAYAFFGSGPR